MTKIAMCKQQEDETVSQYLTRLTEVHNVHSGLRSPEEITAAEITPYEAHLRNSFINGMKDEIAKRMVTQPLEEGAAEKQVAEEAVPEVDLAGALFAEQWTTGRGSARTDSPNRPWRLSDRVTDRGRLRWRWAAHKVQNQVKAALPQPAEGKLHDLEPGDWMVVKDFRRENWKAKRWLEPFKCSLQHRQQLAVKIAERAIASV